MVILVLDVLLARPLAAEREDAVLDVDVDVLLPHAGQLRLEHEALFLLENVHRRRPSSPDGLIAAHLAGHVPEEPVDPVLYAGDTPEWIEAYECHFVHLLDSLVLHECSLRSQMERVKQSDAACSKQVIWPVPVASDLAGFGRPRRFSIPRAR